MESRRQRIIRLRAAKEFEERCKVNLEQRISKLEYEIDTLSPTLEVYPKKLKLLQFYKDKLRRCKEELRKCAAYE